MLKTTTTHGTPPTPPTPPKKEKRLLGLREVAYKTDLAKPTIYRLLAEIKETGDTSLFPVPVQVSKGRIGWHESEVDAWIMARPRV